MLFVNMGSLNPDQMHRTGLKEATPEELKKLKKVKIKKIRANKLAMERINSMRKERGQAPLPMPPGDLPEYETEITPEFGASAPTDTSSTSTGSVFGAGLPTGVDNSSLVAFPTIGDQSTQSSCVAWSTTYYLMSHEVCLTLGCNNKTSRAKVFSPRWTYNTIADGVDGGTSFEAARSLIEKHGAVTLADLPYNPSVYSGWDLNPDHWRSAITWRLKGSSMKINTDAGIALAKEWLTNGHVLNFGTYIYSWVYSTVKTNPNAASNPFVGQQIATYMKPNRQGAHAMTIVGFNDEIWTDINGDGRVDAGELGAFKIANSWGSSWGNSGFVWISYDAFRAGSLVPNFDAALTYQREQMASEGLGLAETYSPYSPKLLAKFTLSHMAAGQIMLQFGSSSSAVTSPEVYWTPQALFLEGGAYAFDGSTRETSGTFYFDFSELLTSALDQINQQNFYFLYLDTTADNKPLTLSSFELVDPVSGATLASASGLPLSADNSRGTLMVGNAMSPPPSSLPSPTPTPTPIPPSTIDTQAPSIPAGVSAVLSGGKGRKAMPVVSVKWSASTDNVGVSKYIIYRNGVKLAETTSLSYSDSATVAGSSYTYQVTAVDAQGNESAKSNSATVNR